MRRRSLLLLVAICGCADVLGLGEFGDKDASAIDASDATFDAPSEAANDASSDADADASCASSPVNESAGIFVATSGSTDTTTCGTMTVPCASIQTGLDRAHVITGKSIVYVARGNYAESVRSTRASRSKADGTCSTTGSRRRGSKRAPIARARS